MSSRLAHAGADADAPATELLPCSGGDALARIRRHNHDAKAWLVVLDDDPTGAQAVHDMEILLAPDRDALLSAAQAQRPVFVLTNSRSMNASEAAETHAAVAAEALAAADKAGVRPVLISRGDSTLRGHFAEETHAVGQALAASGQPVDAIVFAPAFLEAGRLTANDTQWVVQDDGGAVPVNETEFARDATFGYTERDLRSWVISKTGSQPDAVRTLPMQTLRAAGGVEAAFKILAAAREAAVIIVNATHPADLEVAVLACQAAQRAGKRLVYRSGPSLVRVLAGQPPQKPLTVDRLRRLTAASRVGDGPGLIVVGSHTELATRQVEDLEERHKLPLVELNVDALLDTRRRPSVTSAAIEALTAALRRGDTVLTTSRTAHTGADRDTSLRIAQTVSSAVCDVIGRLDPALPLRFIIAKGGITSHEVAARGVRARRAMVVGQFFPGQVSAILLGPEAKWPGIPYAIFPGNVGATNALSEVFATLKAGTRC